jgi:hypothetical protein
LVANSTLGGLASIAGGGKFANGAVTGAFGYLFNGCGSPKGCAVLFSSGFAIGGGFLAAGAVEVGTFGLATPVVMVPAWLGAALGGAFGWGGWLND